MLAETIQLSGPEVAGLLAIFVVILLVLAGTLVVSLMAANRAGKGSRMAMFVWAGFAGLEAVWLVSLLAQLSKNWVWPVAIVAAQGAAYYRGTQKRAPGS